MARDPSLRASDDDRERVAVVLREAYAAGRLTNEEFTERLDATYAARTFGDLAPLTADLPAQGEADPRIYDLAKASAAQLPRRRSPVIAIWGTWLTVTLITTAIWMLGSISSHQLQNFWPIWPIGLLGAVTLARTLGGGPRNRP